MNSQIYLTNIRETNSQNLHYLRIENYIRDNKTTTLSFSKTNKN